MLSDKCYVIAEIGQNHQGCLEKAKNLMKSCVEAGASCVKFQKSDLKSKFTASALARPYISENAFGSTYGEHKECLELTKEQYKELKDYAEEELKVDFTASAMDEVSLEFLLGLDVPFIKIGSGDTNNFPLLRKAAKCGKPVVLSTGMQEMATIHKAVRILTTHNSNVTLLHCVSAYPQPPSETNLSLIRKYQEEFPSLTIGYSGHELGITLSLAAVALGAKVIERHVTLDKNLKGTDHKCSLLPSELKEMIEQIRIIEAALGQPLKKIQPSELSCKQKLGKTLVAVRNLNSGHVLEDRDICVKVSEPRGIEAEDFDEVVGRVCSLETAEDTPILWEHLE